MELRCAENPGMTEWSDPIWMYPVYYYRALPYDPVRPWKVFVNMPFYSPYSPCIIPVEHSKLRAGVVLYKKPPLEGWFLLHYPLFHEPYMTSVEHSKLRAGVGPSSFLGFGRSSTSTEGPHGSVAHRTCRRANESELTSTHVSFNVKDLLGRGFMSWSEALQKC